MASNLDMKSRDIRDELDADDPLLELTRIMGLAPRRDDYSDLQDPQISIEDDFSLDLEQELQLDQNTDVELSADDYSIDDDFSQSFEDELSQSLQINEPTPSDVPSLEDELEALLAGAPEHGSVEAFLPEQIQELEVAPSANVEQGLAYQTTDVQEPSFEPEPWLAAEFEPFMEGAQKEAAAEPIVQQAVVDPILTQMNRVFGRSNLTASEPIEGATLLQDQPIASQAAIDLDESFYAGEIDFETNEQSEPLSLEVADVQVDSEDAGYFEDQEDVELVETDWELPTSVQLATNEYDDPLKRLVGKTVLEPVVEATEIEADAITAMDELDIPDFDLQPEATLSATNAYDLDDDYRGYEPPVARAHVDPIEPEIEDFAIDMASHDDGSDLDFESMLNDELTASVDETDNRFGYQASATGAMLAGAAAINMHKNEYHNALPDAEFLADDIDAPAQRNAQVTQKSTWLIAAAVGAIALLGAGYYALSGPVSGSAGDAPVLVKADPDPVKIAPETPGGKTVANQDQAVYDKVGSEGAALPSQGELVSESEEPVDIASVAVNDTVDPNAKAEDRVDPALEAVSASGQAADTLAVSPKKVRTVIVKPDGTLVERPADTAAAIPADAVTQAAVPATPAVEASAAVAETPAVEAPVVEAPEATTEVAAVSPEPTIVPDVPAAEEVAKVDEAVVDAPKAAPAIKVVKTKKIRAPVAETAKAQTEDNAGAAPVLESRPADQPVNIVGKTGKTDPVAETQVAAADPVTEAPVAGSYSMQIASTPSPEAAKSTYAALSRKFGGVLGGRGVNVQKAQVEGKGTVYRVRIPAGSKQEAAALCQQYKSAGGNCFITK